MLLSASLSGAERGFAIIVDNETYTACKAEIDNYRNVLENEGFSAVVVARVWSDPVQVKDVLYKMYQSNNLKGAIFIGQIPIAMIRDAQHFTSAFKMDQELFPYESSSVPSDRFYDDFDLKFDYLGKDSVNALFHYYSLRWDSPQKISSDIYSGRLKPTLKGEEGHAQIRWYFKKLLSERSKSNKLDIITSYTGEGSFSNSLTAWREEGHTLREQFPNAFYDKNSVKFLLYNMYPYMKDIVTDELRRDEMDLMIFHEHGLPHRQYLTAAPKPKGVDEYSKSARSLFRSLLRKESNLVKREELKQAWMNHYKIDSTWFAGVDDAEQIIKDSLDEIRTGIVIEDVAVIKPNARMVIFDACYNADFREERYIAGEYIFAEGKTLVSFGNSVNVLQDKSSSDLMSMLGMGFSVGEWAQMTNILESHIIGDPTFSFKGEERSSIDFYSNDTQYWLNLYTLSAKPDIKGVALHKLFNLKYPEMPELLVNTYKNSESYMLRLQSYHLLQYYNTAHFGELIKKSLYDPYEFIRRKSLFSMARIGSESYIPYVASVYVNDYLDERVHFNSMFCFDMMDMDKLSTEVKRQFDQNRSYFDKEAALANFEKTLTSRKSIAKMADAVTDKSKPLNSRLSAVKMLRNNAYHTKVEDFIKVLEDKSEDLTLRVKLAEALGWFTLSEKRAVLVNSFRDIAASPDTDKLLREELLKSVARIEVYMR